MGWVIGISAGFLLAALMVRGETFRLSVLVVGCVAALAIVALGEHAERQEQRAAYYQEQGR